MIHVIRQKIADSRNVTIPDYTRRDVYVPGIKGKVLAVIGMRRTGKSTFLWQLLHDRLTRGASRESQLYFSFEDERLYGMSTAELDAIIEEFYRQSPGLREKEKCSFFFDEIQSVPQWERFVRRLIDTENAEVFISGSSSRLLSRELATSMRGRALEVLVHPFSFREYLRHLGIEPRDSVGVYSKSERSLLEKSFRDYLRDGGFPEAIKAEGRDRAQLLRSYVDTAILRDVIERYNVSHPAALRWLVRHLLSNAAGTFSISKFYNDLRSQGMAVAKDTLYDYLSHLEDAFLVRILPIETDSQRRRIVNPRKVYPVDTGLIAQYSGSSKENTGHALECCILLELERRGARLSYVKNETATEVDFCARYHDARCELIQVCADMENEEVLKREVRGLIDASIAMPEAVCRIITLENSRPKDLPDNIIWSCAVSWLLGFDSY